MVRGIRNHNPGNLIITNIPWLGKVPRQQNTDNKFEQFTALKYGCRALLLNLESAIKLHGRSTILKIIAVYAPPNENQTESYITTVEGLTHLNRNEAITTLDQVCAIASAICSVENGNNEAIKAGLTQQYFLEVAKEFDII